MVQKYSWFKVRDNSGIVAVKCLQTYKQPRIKIGQLILTVVKRQLYGRRSERKRMYFGMVTTTKRGVFRQAGAYYCRFRTNSVVLLTLERDRLVGTRFFTPLLQEVRRSAYREICQFSRSTF